MPRSNCMPDMSDMSIYTKLKNLLFNNQKNVTLFSLASNFQGLWTTFVQETFLVLLRTKLIMAQKFYHLKQVFDKYIFVLLVSKIFSLCSKSRRHRPALSRMLVTLNNTFHNLYRPRSTLPYIYRTRAILTRSWLETALEY